MIDLSKLKVADDVVCDEGDYLEAQVAIYYDNDPDDPTPLFGDSSSNAVAMERMLQDGMSNGMVNAGALYVLHQALMCKGYTDVKNAKGAASKVATKVRKEETAELWKPYKKQFLLLLSTGYGLDNARRKVWRTMGDDGVYLKGKPCMGRDAPMPTLRRQLPDPDK